MSTASSDPRARLAALLLFLVAIAVRLIGIGWGLPNDLRNASLHPDEPVVYWNYAYRPNVLLPGNYNYPTLYPLMLRGAGDVVAGVQGLQSPLSMSAPQSLDGYKDYFTRAAPHQRAVLLAGRVISCIAGAATCVVVFWLLLNVAGMAAGLLGGGLLAVSPGFVVHSRFATVDVLATLFLWLAVLYAVKLYYDEVPRLDTRYAVLGGIFAGLSAGTKYTGILALLCIWLALLLCCVRSKRELEGSGGMVLGRAAKLSLFALLAAAVVFLLTTPGAIFDHQAFMAGIQAEQAHMHQDQELTFAATPVGYIYQIGNLFTGMGPVALLVGLAGLVAATVMGKRWVWIVLPFAIVYFYLIGSSEVKFLRYALPLFPAIACGFGWALAGLMRRPNLKIGGDFLALVGICGLESLAFFGFTPAPRAACFDPRFAGLVGTYRFTFDMLMEDPRDQAARYLKRVAIGRNGSVGLFWEPWFWTVPVIKDEDFLYSAPDPIHDRLVQAYLATTSEPRVVMMSGPREPYFAMATSFELQPFDRIQNMDEASGQLEKFYKYGSELLRIDNDYTVDRTFGQDAPAVDDLMFVQPKVQVYRHK